VFFDSNHIAIQKKIHSYMGINKTSTDFLVINRQTEEIVTFHQLSVRKFISLLISIK